MFLRKTWKSGFQKTFVEYLVITVFILIMAMGTYYFKFPNNFAFGGVSGYSVVMSRLTGINASDFNFIVSNLLLAVGFFALGKSFGLKTIYASLLLTFALSFLERWQPMSRPLTDDPFLELLFAVFLPGLASAFLFNIGASSGGTDIVAMMLKKYTSLNIGSVLFLVDTLAVVLAFFVFDIKTGLYSFIGLMMKSLVIDNVIESINRCKCLNIVSENPDPICDFIINTLNHSATVYEASGAFSHQKKTIIMTTMQPAHALRLRNYIHRTEPTAFILITNSSEIIGKGFLSN